MDENILIQQTQLNPAVSSSCISIVA